MFLKVYLLRAWGAAKKAKCLTAVLLMGAVFVVAGIGLFTYPLGTIERAVANSRTQTETVIRQKLLAYTACYAREMGIAPRWQIEVEFDHEIPADHDDRWAADTEADPDYLTVTFTYNLPYLTNVSDRESRETVIHELVHASLRELLEFIPEEAEELSLRHEEQLATEVSRRPFWYGLCQFSANVTG